MFYERLIKLCESTKEKPTPLIKELGFSTGNLAKWRSGSSPSGDALSIIANHFNVSIDYLLGRTDKPAINTDNTITLEFVELQKLIQDLPPEKIKILIETAKAMK